MPELLLEDYGTDFEMLKAYQTNFKYALHLKENASRDS